MSEPHGKPPLLLIEDVRKHYPITRGLLRRRVGTVRAVDGVDLFLHRGETLGLVGESGCGKSTLGRVILRLEEPTTGRIVFDGQDVLALSASDLLRLRRRMQIIFQDPYASLNPRMTVGRSIGEGLVIHGVGTPAERMERIKGLMEVVGLHPEAFSRYPHEFSGGQRQRVGIARALALNPELIVCDEPLSALDVSIQAQVINLLQDLQEKYSLTYLFISHNLAVVQHLCNRTAVMYLGNLVELAPTEELFRNPLHPYTQALLEAVPQMKPGVRRERRRLPEDFLKRAEELPGCAFAPRCPQASPLCREETPTFEELSPGHRVRCFRV